MDVLSGYFSVGVSMFTAAITFYFWVVKAKQERPHLRVYPADPALGGHAQSSCGDPIKLVFEVKSVVANYSSLPNALLGVQTLVRMRDGTWLEAETRLDPKTSLPLNLPPLHTVRLDLVLTVAVPAVPEGEGCRNTHETFALYRDRYVAQPLQVQVAVKTLGKKRFADVLTAAKRAA